MKSSARNQIKLLNSKLRITEEALNSSEMGADYYLDEILCSQLLNPQQLLRLKSSLLLSKANNPETEEEFRTICSQIKEDCNSNPELNEIFQDYVKAYNKITSLYHFIKSKGKNRLVIYNTENEKEELKDIEAPKVLNYGTSVTRLPSGELFCYGKFKPSSGITLIFNREYNIRMLPSGKPCGFSSTTYFNNSVYCFGGENNWLPLTLSSRFDLHKNRWAELSSIPQADCWCSNVIFNGSILIAGFKSKNIWIYSVDIDSFSTISYDFAEEKSKILINLEDRLFLIECDAGLIYESEVKDEYAWKQIGKSLIYDHPYYLYYVYNKGGIYIITNLSDRYYKFDLGLRKMISLQEDEIEDYEIFY